jgi:hypothetical protein
LHPSAIRLGFVGTRDTISSAKEMVDQFASPIESENVKTIGERRRRGQPGLFDEQDGEPTERRQRLEKILNRDFAGFSHGTPWACRFEMNPRWERALLQKDVDVALLHDDPEVRITTLLTLFEAEVAALAGIEPRPDVIVLALTPAMLDRARRTPIKGNFYLDFRRAVKARTMKWGIPLQLLQKRTVLGKSPELQERATRAWNFCTAQYFKAQGVPWRPMTLDPNTCYVGIDFYVAQDEEGRLTMRSAVAQAFDYLGQGLVLRGEPFAWDAQKHGNAPHLTREGAHRLLRAAMQAYTSINVTPPHRVVVHKPSVFWGADRGEHDELAGFREGIDDVFPRCASDLVALRQSGVWLFREGNYPPLRGTYFEVDGQHFLYTMGYIPYLETYPGSYVPEPWQITDHHGDSAPKDLLREILALTKLNVNNCAFADGTPITLGFAEAIGEIMKHVPKGETPQPFYRYYM